MVQFYVKPRPSTGVVVSCLGPRTRGPIKEPIFYDFYYWRRVLLTALVKVNSILHQAIIFTKKIYNICLNLTVLKKKWLWYPTRLSQILPHHNSGSPLHTMTLYIGWSSCPKFTTSHWLWAMSGKYLAKGHSANSTWWRSKWPNNRLVYVVVWQLMKPLAPLCMGVELGE